MTEGRIRFLVTGRNNILENLVARPGNWICVTTGYPMKYNLPLSWPIAYETKTGEHLHDFMHY